MGDDDVTTPLLQDTKPLQREQTDEWKGWMQGIDEDIANDLDAPGQEKATNRRQSMGDVSQAKADKESQMLSHLQLVLGGLFLLWLLLGIFWYESSLNLPFFKAFYFHVQSGFSIGFGTFAGPSTDSFTEMFVTVIFVLTGSSFIGSFIGFMMGSALLETHPWYIEKLKMSILVDKLDKDTARGRQLRLIGGKSWEVMKVNGAVWFAKCQMSYRNNKIDCLALGICLLYITGAVFYAVFVEHKTIVQGIFFGVTSLSTAGLYNIVERDSPQFDFFIVGTYCLFGIPVYAAALGRIANWVLGEYEDSAQSHKMNRKFTHLEFQAIAALSQRNKDGSKKNTVSIGDFYQAMLLRLGVLEVETLQEIAQLWDRLQAEAGTSSDVVNYDAFVKAGFMSPHLKLIGGREIEGRDMANLVQEWHMFNRMRNLGWIKDARSSVYTDDQDLDHFTPSIRSRIADMFLN